MAEHKFGPVPLGFVWEGTVTITFQMWGNETITVHAPDHPGIKIELDGITRPDQVFET